MVNILNRYSRYLEITTFPPRFCSGEIERHLPLSDTLLQGYTYRYIKSGLPRTPLRS